MQAAPQVQQMQVTVPPGVMPGQAFVIQTPVGQMQVTVPPDGVPGMPMTVMVPATVQPTMAAPVPMAMELQPVAMGIVLDTGVAQPMAGQPVAMQPVPQAMMMAPTPAMGTWPVEFKIDHKDGAACEALKSAMPVSLHSAGVTQNEWGQIVDLLHAHLKRNFFYNKGGLEVRRRPPPPPPPRPPLSPARKRAPPCPPRCGAALASNPHSPALSPTAVCGASSQCCYYCVPLGPIQTCVCLLNPITCIVCFGPDDSSRKKTMKQIDELVTRHGLTCEITSEAGDGSEPVKFTARLAG